MKIIMFSMAIISALNIMGYTITTYGQDEVDKANDNKDQTKDSMQITVKQEFIWKDN